MFCEKIVKFISWKSSKPLKNTVVLIIHYYTLRSVFGPQYVEVSIRLRTWTFAHLTVLYWTGISESAGAKQTDVLVIGLEMRRLF